MTLGDERIYYCKYLDITFIDLTKENGALYASKGSHRIFPTYRGSTIPNIYAEVQSQIVDFMTPVYLKAGEAIIFDQSIIHYSPPNLSNQKRVVTNIYFTQVDATFRTAYYNPEIAEDKVELFEQDDNFMTDFEQFGENIYDRPKIGNSLGLMDYTFPKLSMEYLNNHYQKSVQKQFPEKGIWKNIVSIFK